MPGEGKLHVLHLQSPATDMEKIFIIAARIEAFTWFGLITGMYFKYNLEVTDLGVWLFGRLHGIAFLIYFVVAIVAAVRLRWSAWHSILAILAAIPPLATLPLEVWFTKKGILSAPVAKQSETA